MSGMWKNAALLFLALTTLSASTLAEPPNAQIQAWSKGVYEKAEAGDGLSIETYAKSLALSGAYPNFKPDPRGGIRYLEQRVSRFSGNLRFLLDGTLANLRAFADKFEKDQAGAAAGDPQSLYAFGSRYLRTDEGVEYDQAKALEYYELASAKGHAQSSYAIAQFAKEDPATMPKAIAYMQKSYAQGNKSAAPWLRDWNAPLSPEHAAVAVAQQGAAAKAATAFAAGTFSPLFWGTADTGLVRKTSLNREQILPMLYDVRDGKAGAAVGPGYKAWGLPLGSSPTRQQLLAAAQLFNPCILRPITPNNVLGMELSDNYSVRFEEWEYGNRKTVYVTCSIQSPIFNFGDWNWQQFYFVDGKLVAVQAIVNIYDAAQPGMGANSTVCSDVKRAPSQLVGPVRTGDPSWKITRQISLSRTPLSGVGLGDWYTLTKPGAVMHIFPRSWPNLTRQGETRNGGQCGSGFSEYLVLDSKFNAALQITGAKLPELRIGRPASL